MSIQVQRIVQLTGHSGAVYALSQGRGESFILTGSADNMVAEWSLADRAVQPFSIRLPSTIYSLCYIPSKQLLLIGNSTGGIHVVDIAQKEEIRYFTYHTGGIFDLQYHEKTDRFYALSGAGDLSVWDAEDLALVHQINICNKKLRQVAFNPFGSEMAVACGDGIIRVYDSQSYELKQELSGHESSVNAVVYHPQRELLISGGKDAHLRFWKSGENYKSSGAIPAHNFAIYKIAFSPDARWCATASRDKTVKIWDGESFEILKRLERKDGGHMNSVNNLIWTHYKDYLVSTGDDRSLIVWEVSG